jgi:hypothetical protein
MTAVMRNAASVGPTRVRSKSEGKLEGRWRTKKTVSSKAQVKPKAIRK